MTELVSDEITFEPSCAVDPLGRVFYLDGRVFRAIRPSFAGFVENTLERATRDKWFDAGLIATWRTDYTLPGYPLVIEHKRIPFVTLRGEWSAEGLRAAALCILNLSATLWRADLCLQDAHPWNILFDGTTPHFIDWGSHAPSEALNWPVWYEQFRQFLLAPLYAFSIGEPRIARAMLREHKIGVGNEIVGRQGLAHLPDVPRRIAESAGTSPGVETFEALATYVATLDIPHVEGEWTAYEQPRLHDGADCGSLREKDRIVHRLLAGDDGESLIDVGTNYGLHSEMAASLGKRVIACDIEESCLNSLFVRARAMGNGILPLYHDFLWPIGTSGILNSIPAAEERLACDTALVMAVTHHLAFKQHISFEAMALGISRLAKRRAIVEFVPAEDAHVARWAPEALAWYTEEHFIAAMRRRFRCHTVIQSEPRPRRVIVFEH